MHRDFYSLQDPFLCVPPVTRPLGIQLNAVGLILLLPDDLLQDYLEGSKPLETQRLVECLF